MLIHVFIRHYPFNVIGLCDAFNIYLGWKYFHPHSCRCHLANRDHCENKILSLDCFYPWWQVWWHPVFIYCDVYMYFSLNKAIYLSIYLSISARFDFSIVYIFLARPLKLIKDGGHTLFQHHKLIVHH